MTAPIGKISKKAALTLTDARVEGVEGARVALDTRQDFSREIGKLWAEARDRFVLIGRRLIEAKKKLAHGEWKILVERELPFSQSIAFQLRCVAEAIDSGRIPADNIPASYSIAYQISTLSDTELRRARSEGVIRVDVSRNEVMAFKKKVRSSAELVLPVMPESAGADEIAALRSERDRLLARLHAINNRFRELGRMDDVVVRLDAAGALIEGTATQIPEDIEAAD